MNTGGMQNEFYGSNISQDINGLVKSRVTISGQYLVENRTFEMGVLLNEYIIPSGFIFKHRYFLTKNRGAIHFTPESQSIRTYVVYHFTYNNRKPNQLLKPSVYRDQRKPIIMKDSITSIVNTIEHNIGIGLEKRIIKGIYLNISVEGGIYFLRENRRIVFIDGQLRPKMATGFFWNSTIGLGYWF